MVCVVDHYVIFTSLRPELSEVKPDFLVHRNLYLPRAIFVIVVITGVVC